MTQVCNHGVLVFLVEEDRVSTKLSLQHEMQCIQPLMHSNEKKGLPQLEKLWRIVRVISVPQFYRSHRSPEA